MLRLFCLLQYLCPHRLMSADVSMNTDEGTAITHWVWDTAKVEYNLGSIDD